VYGGDRSIASACERGEASPTIARAVVRLIVNPGHRDQREYELRVGTTTIGRGHESDLRIADRSLSRRHASVDVDAAGNATLRDIGSKNGTFIDGRRLDGPQPLINGQEFCCGDVVFGFATAGFSVAAPETIVRELSTEAPRALVDGLLNAARKRKRKRSEALEAEQRLQVLLDVARLLSSPEPIDKQLVKILDLVFTILEVDRAAIILIDEQTGEFGAPVVESRRGDSLTGEANRYSKNILNYVRERSVAALFADVAVDPRLEHAQSIHAASVRSSICAPLRPHDRVIGVLYVDNLTTPGAFGGDDLELLSAFAAQAAIAIENSRLYHRLEREAVARNNLLRFFPPTTIAQLMDGSGALAPALIETEVTALFCDISGYTAMSASMAPREVVALLNRYFPILAEIVFRHDGTLEKYIGDALLAVWGAPFQRDDDARRAVQAAVDMQAAIEQLAGELALDPPLRIHIGLNTGVVAAGNIGSEHYLQYAAIGDATNLASRICNLAGPGEIALGAPTVERLDRSIAWPSWGLYGPELHQVKGHRERLPVYTLRRTG
jgi:adenylate cyclase